MTFLSRSVDVCQVQNGGLMQIAGINKGWQKDEQKKSMWLGNLERDKNGKSL